MKFPKLLLLLLICSCQEQLTLNVPNSNGSTSTPPEPSVSLGLVQARYEIAPNWNDYYLRSNPTLACTGVEIDCEHGGELKKVAVTGRSSCMGLTMSDTLTSFDWSCEAGAQVIFYGKLKPAISVANLVTSTGWILNSVTLLENGTQRASTSPSAWHTNPVMELPSASAATQVLSVAGTVYVASVTPAAPVRGYNLNADKITVVLKPGVTLTSAGTLNTDATTKKYNASGVSTIIAVGYQKYVSIEGSHEWAYGVRPTQWSFDGGGVSPNYVIGLAYSKYLRLKKISQRNGSSRGMHHQSLFAPTLDRITMADNGIFGVAESSTSFGRWTNVNCFACNYSLVDLNGTSYTLFENIYSKDHTIQGPPNNNGGIWLNGGNTLTFRNVQILNSVCTGLSVRNTSNSTFTNIQIKNSGASGIGCGAEAGNGLHVLGGGSNVFKTIRVESSAGSGISLVTASSQTFIDVVSVNNGTNAAFTGRAGIREVGAASNNVYSGITVANNGLEGMSLNNTNSAVSGVIATHNGTHGITIGAAVKAITAATVAYNGGHGINQIFINASTIYHNILALKNSSSGVYIANDSLGPTLSNVATLSNTRYGVEVGAASTPPSVVKIVGNLLVSENTIGKCALAGATSGLSLTSGCSLTAPSTGSITDLGGTAVNALIGAVTSDSINASAVTGRSLYSALTDWPNFENSSRSWGKLSGTTGSCLVGGETCQIWDWSTKATDTFIKNTTFDAVAQNGNFIHQATCPVNLSGSRYEISQVGLINFLRLAVEDIASAIGNKNGLCENGEECLYTPNFGAFQGTGSFSTCVFDDEGSAIDVLKMSAYSVQ